MECEVCGSRNTTRTEVEGYLLYECNLCGNLQGDDEAAERIEELRRGRDRGLDDEVIALVSVLESAGVFRVTQCSAGAPERREWPYLFFTLLRSDTSWIEKLLRSIELANRETTKRWLIELSLQHGIVYILRPRFWKNPSDITPEEIRVARADLSVLAERLRRDLALSWWRE